MSQVLKFQTKTLGVVEINQADLIVANRVIECLEISPATLCKVRQALKMVMMDVKQIDMFDQE